MKETIGANHNLILSLHNFKEKMRETIGDGLSPTLVIS